MLTSLGLEQRIAAVAIALTVLWEWVLGTMLLIRREQIAPLFFSIATLAIFNSVLLCAKLNGFGGQCGCLGLASTVRQAVVRNAALIAVAVIGLMLHNKIKLKGAEL